MARQLVDTDHGQMSVETGVGSVMKVEHDPAKRNAKVTVRADHLKDPIHGWLDTHDADLRQHLADVQAAGGRCAYRIDVARSKDVDPALPWEQVPQGSRFRRLVGLLPENRLVELVPNLVGVGAPAAAHDSAATPAQDAPGPTQPPPAAPSAATHPRATEAAAKLCGVCTEALAGQPVKRTPRGFVHVACLDAPFADNPEAAAKAQAVAEEAAAILAARRSAAQAVADAGGDPHWLVDAGREATEARHAGWRCETCQLVTTEPPDAHNATAVHQGKARQAAQAAELAARREAQVADATRFDGDAAPVNRPPRIPLPSPRGNGPRVEEGRPWERHNSDGSVNMGSYAVTAALSTVEWAQDLCIARVRDVAGDTGEQAHLDLGQVRALARMLLDAADRCQAASREDGHVDRMDNSHTRARGALRASVKVYPVPWGADADVKARWVEDLAAHAAHLIRMAAELDK